MRNGPILLLAGHLQEHLLERAYPLLTAGDHVVHGAQEARRGGEELHACEERDYKGFTRLSF